MIYPGIAPAPGFEGGATGPRHQLAYVSSYRPCLSAQEGRGWEAIKDSFLRFVAVQVLVNKGSHQKELQNEPIQKASDLRI
jgi:hypothetical protein